MQLHTRCGASIAKLVYRSRTLCKPEINRLLSDSGTGESYASATAAEIISILLFTRADKKIANELRVVRDLKLLMYIDTTGWFIRIFCEGHFSLIPRGYLCEFIFL